MNETQVLLRRGSDICVHHPSAPGIVRPTSFSALRF
jgi:hypothetical protein